MPCDLQPGIGVLECSHSADTGLVLRGNQRFENIKVRRLHARPEPELHILGKLADLWNQPPQNVACKDDSRWLIATKIFVAGAFGTGDKFRNDLLGVGNSW